MRIEYPDLEVLNARARRERAEAVYRLLVQPVMRFFSRKMPEHVQGRALQG
jgi:hypothetical protein